MEQPSTPPQPELSNFQQRLAGRKWSNEQNKLVNDWLDFNYKSGLDDFAREIEKRLRAETAKSDQLLNPGLYTAIRLVLETAEEITPIFKEK